MLYITRHETKNCGSQWTWRLPTALLAGLFLKIDSHWIRLSISRREWDWEIKINWSDLTKKSFERKIKLIFNSLSGFGLLGSILSTFQLLNFPRFYLLVENINMFFSLSIEGDQTGRCSTDLPGLGPGRTIGENLLGNHLLQTSINNPRKIFKYLHWRR